MARSTFVDIIEMMGNTNELKRQPPWIIVHIANLVICLGLVFSILVIAISIYRVTDFVETSQSLQFYQITLLGGVIFAALFGLGLRLTESSKENLSLLALSITAPILGTETYSGVFIISLATDCGYNTPSGC